MRLFQAFLISIAVLTIASFKLFGADTNATADAEAKYTAAIEGRTAGILEVLVLNDTNTAANVHDIVMAQYRALNAWHNENDARLKAVKADTNAVAAIRASLKVVHDSFLSKLAGNLTPEQVEKVKDKMTYGKVQFTYAGYMAQYPDLSETNRVEILNLLRQAREEAMDGGSADEKTAIFQRYKGKINNYLSKQGVHAEKKKGATKPAATNAAPDKPAN